MAVVQFKFDESYDSRIMSVGGWIANEQEWKKLESTWQRRIDFENSHCRDDQKITRYHATEMNCKRGEFEHWDKDMSLKLTKKLIDLVAKRKMGAIVTSCDMQAIQNVFKGGDVQGKKRRAYILCMKQTMVEVAHIMEQYFPGDTVLLIHDSGNWDAEALQGYKLLVDDPDWPRQGLFEGIVSKTGKESVGLQAADMIAYEVFKGVKDKTNDPEVEMRKAMKAIAAKAPVSARWINEPAAQALYRVMNESGKYPKLDEQGVW
jgi:hypothetical protein